MKAERIGVVRDAAITSSLLVGSQPWKPINLSAQIYLTGNLSRDMANTEGDKERQRELLDIANQHLLEAEQFEKQFREEVSLKIGEISLEKQKELERELEILDKKLELEKRLRKYKRSDPAETWSSRWIASPIAYLLPEERREEWLGDLYEVNREMLHKNYPRWIVNVINVGKTAILVVSAVQIKISDLVGFFGKVK
jgi:hypothetical protein